MASRAGGVLQDQNLNVHYNDSSVGWKTNVTKAPRKGGLGGRTPLGDLSNSLKPSLNQKSKKQQSGIFSFAEKQTVASQVEVDSSKKSSTSKVIGKVQGVGRKPLSDISNSGKLRVKEASKKSYNSKLSVLAEEPIDPSAIAEEQFLHNHEECIKAQTRSMDLDEFLKIIGLDIDLSKQPKTYYMPGKEEIPLRPLELEEMPVPLLADKSCKYELFDDLGSPSPCSTPRWLKDSSDGNDLGFNFKLIESPLHSSPFKC